MNPVSPPSLSQQPYDYVYYIWFMRFNALLNTLITVLVIYLIIKRTPKEMEIYKWFLLNLSVCCYLLDMHLTVTFIPLLMFPTTVMCVLGAMSAFGRSALYVAWVS
ncbi:serpentine type 7TM GPCR chemoreceptor srh domain-containing protein [Ditylenchus destructor]|uniref:Serpentine type 7TM GPCR chemoreceptor srh domain-containing protein n=1 Tax=Ditylenchus destructor TaxID=166010 RepID=A0AAD4MKC4_9BILA|nr:serpentine type 7TM GPCR chemoreceptor srh domain-containing protein [Ditylenchus destructor]